MKTKITFNSTFFNNFFLLFCISHSFSQTSNIKLIGFHYTNDRGTSVVEWNAGETVFDVSSPTNVQGILVGSSTFDSRRADFFGKVLDNTSGQTENNLFKYNTNTNTISLFPINSFFNGGSEVDMQYGYVYTYDGDENNNVFLNKYDPTTGESTNLGYFGFDATTGFFPDSTCYDTNSKTYYFLILVGSEVKIVSASVASQPLSFTVTTLVNYNNLGNIGLEFSNETNKIYAMYPSINQATGNYAIDIGELNPSTGQFSALVNLPNTVGYQLANRTYDQQSESFIFVGLNSNGNFNLYSVNTATTAVEVLELPEGNISEIECDNSTYAVNKYGVLSVNQNSISSVSLFPNPMNNYFQVNFNGVSSDYSITDLLGKTIQSGSVTNQEKININNLSKGVYVFKMSWDNQTFTKKIIVK